MCCIWAVTFNSWFETLLNFLISFWPNDLQFSWWCLLHQLVSLSDYEQKNPSPLNHVTNVMRGWEVRERERERLSYFKPMKFGCIFFSQHNRVYTDWNNGQWSLKNTDLYMFLYYRNVQGSEVLIENMNLPDRYILETFLAPIWPQKFYFILL